jgi:hypothetical protein
MTGYLWAMLMWFTAILMVPLWLLSVAVFSLLHLAYNKSGSGVNLFVWKFGSVRLSSRRGK